MTITPEDLGRAIKERREERGLTQTDLAAPLFTPAYISMIEAGKRQPSTRVVRHIERVLDAHLPDPTNTDRGRRLQWLTEEIERLVEDVQVTAPLRRYVDELLGDRKADRCSTT